MAAATNNIGNIPSPPLNTGYNPEGNVGAGGIRQLASQIAAANQSEPNGLTAVVGPTRAFTPAPISFTPPPPRTKTATPPETPIYTPPPAPPAPEEPEELPKGPVAKDPQPPMPDIDVLVGRKRIGTRPDRYKVGEADYTISALSDGVGSTPNIKPIVLPKGVRPELKPLLRVNGVVVKAGEHYLVSPQTLADITKSDNPHYDIVENGRIGDTVIGKTVPIIEINIDRLVELGDSRDVVNGIAAVKSVEYVHETPTIMGISEGIVEQINYTLDPNTPRPKDAFEVWELNLTGDYSVQQLVIDSAQPDGKLDKAKLKTFVTEVGKRMVSIQNDLNIIKNIFYRGSLPTADRKSALRINKRAETIDLEEERSREQTSTFVIKKTAVVSHSATPNSTPTEAPVAPTGPTPTESPELTSAAGESDAAIAKWVGYGFTAAEKAEVKRIGITNIPPVVVVANDISVGIGGARFSPTVAAKARIVLPISGKALNGQQELFEQYYGVGLGLATWNLLNRQRVADLMLLSRQIRELEEANSKIY